MEEMYKPSSFKCSQPMQIKDYFEKYSEICLLGIEDCILNKCEMEGVDFSEYSELCSIDKLKLDTECSTESTEIPDKLLTKTKLDPTYPVNDEARQLHVIKCKEDMETKKPQVEFMFVNKRFLKTIIANKEPTLIGDIKPGTNFIYSILVYRPFSIKFGQRNSTEKLRFAFEIEALGTNTLADLADSITCTSNTSIVKKVDNTKVDLSEYMNAKRYYPSQTIFIDGVFYNDGRICNSTDYAQKIINWAEEKNFGKFTTSKMEETLLNSLTPKLGYPYVYMHQGSCEHIFCFSDVRLITADDCLTYRKYPRIISISRKSSILCFICSKSPAQWMIVRCERFPQEKVFLCTECCDSYLYIDNKKVTEFDLYPYFDLET